MRRRRHAAAAALPACLPTAPPCTRPPAVAPPSAPHPCRSWLYDTKLLWSHCHGLPCDGPIAYGERLIYCITLGFYTQASAAKRGVRCRSARAHTPRRQRSQARRLVLQSSLSTINPPACAQAVPMLFIWETKRSDRLESFAHHVATIVLIGYSYYLK